MARSYLTAAHAAARVLVPVARVAHVAVALGHERARQRRLAVRAGEALRVELQALEVGDLVAWEVLKHPCFNPAQPNIQAIPTLIPYNQMSQQFLFQLHIIKDSINSLLKPGTAQYPSNSYFNPPQPITPAIPAFTLG